MPLIWHELYFGGWSVMEVTHEKRREILKQTPPELRFITPEGVVLIGRSREALPSGEKSETPNA